MCRLFGSVGITTIEHREFEKLTLMSKKGGPDSTDFYTNENIQFGFNRLAILDTTSKGNQPFVSESGRYVLMLNGEIYNYKEIHRQFSLGELKSGSDAEVVLKLIEKISFDKAIDQINGMFAISCWDTQERKLFLARDFAGIKPLFYSRTSSGIVFGSQFNQILKHPWSKKWSWSNIGLSEYLQFGYMSPPFTIAENVYQLGVGEYLIYAFESKTIEKKVYQRFYEKRGNISELNPNSLENIGEAITNSVKRQLVADVPLGVFLSGGIDSTLVAAKARELNPDLTAVTIGFDDKKLDESEKAIEYAKHLNIKHHHVERFGNQSLLDIIDDHFDDMPEPIADYSSIPTYLVSKIARKTNTVMLSGDGGDELCWGYPRFLTFAKSAPYFSISGQLPRKIIKKTLKSIGSDITGFLGEPNLGAANMAFQSYIKPERIRKYTGDYQISEETLIGHAFYGTNSSKSLDYLRRNEFYFHLQKILVKVDRMSMANSLEVRVPLLDKEVIRASEHLYSELGRENKILKYLLKKELIKYIPLKTINQAKSGFMPPIHEWVENNLADRIKSMFKNGNVLFRKDELEKLIDEFYVKKTVTVESLWAVYVLLVWIERNK
jgi:asparagine synthase (glutamine-hydrolysing)